MRIIYIKYELLNNTVLTRLWVLFLRELWFMGLKIPSAVKLGYHRRLLAFLDSLFCMECSRLTFLCT